MRARVFFLLISCLVFAYWLPAQTVDSTVCDILANPQSFNGKMVRIKGKVVAGFEEFAIVDSNCKQKLNAIWLDYPQGTNAEAGPAALLRLQLAKNSPAAVPGGRRTPITLRKDSEFEKFDKLLSTPAKTHGVCLGCMNFSVRAVLVGRLDAVKETGLIRDSAGKVTGLSGFGNLNRYNARLVLRSVSAVAGRKIDYALVGSVTAKAASEPQSFDLGAPNAGQLKQAAEAFGAEGEDNGVSVEFSAVNEVPKDEGAKGSASSPDGLLFHVILNGKLLKGKAMSIAIAHIGTHIADIRSPGAPTRALPFYGAEFRAWQTAILSAAAAGVNVLSLPGGITIYSHSWPNSELAKDGNAGISAFLTNWVGLASP